MNKIKQVICIRKDLNMRKGKIAAQCAHASMKVFFDRMKVNVSDVNLKNAISRYECENAKYHYKNCNHFKPWVSVNCDLTDEMIEWMEGSFTKVVVQVKDLDELFDIHAKAEEYDIPHAIIEDSGATEFKKKCPECGGFGIFTSPLIAGDDQCIRCKGTGKINKPTITCIALGPVFSNVLDLITGHLKLF